MKTIGVLVPKTKTNPSKPSERPIGRALLELPKNNIRTVFGYDLREHGNKVWISGLTVDQKKDSWIQFEGPIHALHDRYPSQRRAASYLKAHKASSSIPMANPYDITLLCRDKVKIQDLLSRNGLLMPDLCTEHTLFQTSLQKWGKGFIKPQFGALGQGVSCVSVSDDIPEYLEGVVPNQLEKTILQRAITPPTKWAGMSVRHLIQRSSSGSWISRPPVLRRSRVDPVVNVSRGAEAVVAEDHLPINTISAIQKSSLQTAKILQASPNGIHSVEFGIDYVIDENLHPWLIEVNSRPRGRLEVLAYQDPERFKFIHQQACIQPILYLASLCKS